MLPFGAGTWDRREDVERQRWRETEMVFHACLGFEFGFHENDCGWNTRCWDGVSRWFGAGITRTVVWVTQRWCFTVQSGLGLESIENGGVPMGFWLGTEAGWNRTVRLGKGKRDKRKWKKGKGKSGRDKEKWIFFRRGTWRFTFGLELWILIYSF